MSDDMRQIEFVQYRPPPLEAAEYTISATQTIKVAGTQQEAFTTTQTFHVTGPRDTLPPGSVNTVFPPAGNQGEFSNVLPHLVLTDPTLPWLRSPGAQAPRTASWLALLVFDSADDGVPTPQFATIGDLVSQGTILCPPRETEPGEQTTDPVTTIDVPADLFSAIAPSLDDLSWNAHVRHAEPTQKATEGDSVPPPEYALVIGNRLPAPGGLATAHLVSVEGAADYLPANDGTPSPAIPSGTTAVRLVSLHSWSFTAVDLKQTFKQTAEALDMSPATLQLPYTQFATGDHDADLTVTAAMEFGYTAMDHALRDADQTVSWYRGPLLPFGGQTAATPPYSGPDELLRFDPPTGMFDVSYAAAWQLGRLMALRDAAFAAALYRWKLGQTQAAAGATEQDLITAEVDAIHKSDPPDDRTARAEHLLRELVHPAVRRMGRTSDAGA